MTTTEPFAVERVPVGGRRLAVARAGAGRDVLLVHGNFASLRWFGPLLASPPEGVRVTAIDLPNFGRSEPLGGPVSIAAFGDALLEAAVALGLDRPIVVGHSLGGTVAMAAAAASPRSFGGLVLVSSGGPRGLVTPEVYYPFLESYRTNRPALHAALAAMVPTVVPAGFELFVDDAMAMHPDGFSGNARALAHLAEPGMDLSPRLAAFRGPVLVLRGAHDTLIDAATAEATAAAFTHADVALETWDDVGHSPILESPERFRARLASFAAAAPSRGEGGAMR